MLLAAAICPHPPLLVPSVAAGAAHETDDLRAACRTAVATLAPYDTVVVGSNQQALEVGAWLLPDARGVVVTGADDGVRLAAADVAFLVMGDGSARRSLAAPGYLDDRAEPYDAEVARALRDADVDALLALDPVLSDELLVAGRPAWQALAAAAKGATWQGELRYDAAPYGVGYFVATWRRS